MSAATETTLDPVESLVRSAIAQLCEALEDHKRGLLAGASVAATQARQLSEKLDAHLYAVADEKYHFPPPPFALPPACGPHPLHPLCPPSPFLLPMPIAPVHPKCHAPAVAQRTELPAHDDFTLKGTVDWDLTQKGVTE